MFTAGGRYRLPAVCYLCQTLAMIKMLAPSPPTKEEVTHIVEQLFGAEVTAVTSLRSGAWSSAMAVETPNGAYVVRFAQTPDDFRCDQHASKYGSARLPIPQVHGIGRLGDRWWCISDRMPGVHLDELDANGLAKTLPSVAEMLIAIRDVDSGSTSGYGGWDADGNGIFATFGEQLLSVAIDNPEERAGGWSRFLREHTFEQSVFERGLAEMERLTPYLSPTRQLIHMDTINYNVTVVDHRVSGIFDWGCAMWGDAIYDLAWFRFWNPWYPQWADVAVPDRLEDLVGIQGDHANERMMCCLLHIGIGHIRYNAFLGDAKGMNDVAVATERLLVTR